MATRNPNHWYSKDGIDYGYDSKPLSQPKSLLSSVGSANFKTQSAAPPSGFDLSKNSWSFKPLVPNFSTGIAPSNFNQAYNPAPGGQVSTTYRPADTNQLAGNSVPSINGVRSVFNPGTQGGAAVIPVNGNQEDVAAKLHAMDSMGIYGGNGAGSAAAGAKGGITAGAGSSGIALPKALADAALGAAGGFVVTKGLEAGYNAVTGNGGQGSASALEGTLAKLLQSRLDQDAQLQQQRNDLRNNLLGRVNPHGTDSSAFQARLKQRQEMTTQAFNGAERAYMSRVAGGRGMGGYDAAGLGNLVGNRARAFGEVTNNTYAEASDKWDAFENQRDNSLLQLLTGGGDPAGLATALLGRQDNKALADQQTLSTLIASAPGVYKMLKDLEII